jgi:hypothetical protein
MPQEKERMPSITLENVPIIFKNFSGQKGQFNAEGERAFNVLIEDLKMAEDMLADGWNLKPFLDEAEQITAYHLQVKVNYGGYPPRIVRVTKGGKHQVDLNSKTVGSLDSQRVLSVDLTINPYQWTVQGKSGIKAYCHVMFVNVEETPLEEKYAALLDAPFDE